MMDLLRLSGSIEKEHTHKDDEETAYKRDCVDASRGVETGEENGRSDDGSSSEENIVYGVNTIVIFSFICVINRTG